jgi:antitoxin CptB
MSERVESYPCDQPYQGLDGQAHGMKIQLPVVSCQLPVFKVQESENRELETENRKQETELQRVRWRCRRGLLELDIVLGRFIEAHYAHLSEFEQQTFEQFLDMPDNPLWDLISGRQDAASGEQAALLAKIKSV